MNAWEVLECKQFGDIRLVGMYVLVSFSHMKIYQFKWLEVYKCIKMKRLVYIKFCFILLSYIHKNTIYCISLSMRLYSQVVVLKLLLSASYLADTFIQSDIHLCAHVLRSLYPRVDLAMSELANMQAWTTTALLPL